MNKIAINVDIGYAFDMLAISSVKLAKIMNDDEKLDLAIRNNASLLADLCDQINTDKLAQVLGSKEYKALLEKNREVFEAVDKAKNDEVKASYVDRLNYERWVLKNELQTKFFGIEPSEQKIGYDKAN